MNCLRRSRSLLSLLLRRKPAVSTPPPLRPRGYHTFRVPRDMPAHPLPQSTPQVLSRRYQHTGPQRREMTRWTRQRGGSQWYEKDGVQAGAAVLLIAGSSAAVAAMFCRREAVPYTNRTRLIILLPNAERRLGQFAFDREKKKLDSKILSPLDPETVRVRRIVEEIVGAVYRNLASSHQRLEASYGDDTAAARLDENGEKPPRARANLDGLDWEVIVVKNEVVNAMCMPGGKIIVYTEVLDEFREDAEVATILGHEVGHAIARHTADKLTKHLCFLVLEIVISLFVIIPEDILDTAFKYFLELPFSRRMEMEADHVGLMLLAAAGYDPRVAPSVYDRLGRTGVISSELLSYMSTHPACRKRAQLLSQEHVMTEALELYREVVTSRGTKGFPLDSGTQKYGKEISCATSAT